MQPLERNYQIVARSPHLRDFLALLETVRDDVADIRKPLVAEVADTLETRRLGAAILTDVIDKLNRSVKNRHQKSNVGEDIL